MAAAAAGCSVFDSKDDGEKGSSDRPTTPASPTHTGTSSSTHTQTSTGSRTSTGTGTDTGMGSGSVSDTDTDTSTDTAVDGGLSDAEKAQRALAASSVLRERCTSCHASAQLGDFGANPPVWSRYPSLQTLAYEMVEHVQRADASRMPPAPAAPLTADQIAVLQSWYSSLLPAMTRAQ